MFRLPKLITRTLSVRLSLMVVLTMTILLMSLIFHMDSVRYTYDQARQRNEELVEATRLAKEADRQKTEFIQNVSHQIRTPLNIFMGFAQILASCEKLPKDELKSIIDTMERNSKLLCRLVTMLFDSSETGHSEEIRSHRSDLVPCNDVAHEAIDDIYVHYPDLNIRFLSEVADDFCIQTSRLYVMRSLREILHNSAKYSDGQHVTMSVCRTDTTVRFIVEDKGAGIAAGDRDLIFKFFLKVDDLSEGLGLGLPLAKCHAQNLGGDLTLDESYHGGCRFVFELPIVAA